MGFSMSLSSFVGLGFIPSATKTKRKPEHAHRDTDYLGILNKKFSSVMQKGQNQPRIWYLG